MRQLAVLQENTIRNVQLKEQIYAHKAFKMLKNSTVV